MEDNVDYREKYFVLQKNLRRLLLGIKLIMTFGFVFFMSLAIDSDKILRLFFKDISPELSDGLVQLVFMFGTFFILLTIVKLVSVFAPSLGLKGRNLEYSEINEYDVETDADKKEKESTNIVSVIIILVGAAVIAGTYFWVYLPNSTSPASMAIYRNYVDIPILAVSLAITLLFIVKAFAGKAYLFYDQKKIKKG
ncbi:MAG: hypothetical protein LWY06_00115 [Firmicutes bacterium]|nr:hypothetical protein [Bacillota bacterium]